MLISKKTGLTTFKDTSKVISLISVDLSHYLSEEIEELNVSSYLFRDGLNNALSFVFNSLQSKKENILVYPDTIPGFTVMVFKKEDIIIDSELNSSENSVSIDNNLDQDGALNSVLSRFMGKNSNKVMVIENNDIIFALFPVADTKKNLKELGLYITF